MNVNKFKEKLKELKVEEKERSVLTEFSLFFLLAMLFAVQIFIVGILTLGLCKPGFLEEWGLRLNSSQYSSVYSSTSPSVQVVSVGNSDL